MNFRSYVPRAGILFSTLGMTLFASRPAKADHERISIDADAVWRTGSHDDNGWGVGARVGHSWEVLVLSLTPELGLSYHDFGTRGPTDFRGFAGGRVGLDFVLQPSVFVHAGIGQAGRTESQTSLAYDFGAALDLTLLPVDLGIHALYSGIAGDDSSAPFTWFGAGAHVTFKWRS
jgi:hypothetical protein